MHAHVVWKSLVQIVYTGQGDAARRREASYGVARLLLMAPIDPWQILPHFLVRQPSVRQNITILGTPPLDVNLLDDMVD